MALAVQALIDEHVEAALPMPKLCELERADGIAHEHRVIIARMSGHSAAGSDSSLTLIEADLNSRLDNAGKLSGADESTCSSGSTEILTCRSHALSAAEA